MTGIGGWLLGAGGCPPSRLRRVGRAALAVFVLAGLAHAIGATLAAQTPTAASVKQRLVGNWKLVKYEVFGQNGEVRPGNYDAGRIMYGDRGEMTAHLLRSGGASDAPTTDASRAAAYQRYMGYFGPYTIDAANGFVVHHVAGSSLPHWIGTQQIRYYGFPDGDHLTLSLKSGDRITQTLTWERVQ
jgi:lipocalin-like protein